MISASSILITGIIAGSLLGYFAPTAGAWLSTQVDYTLLTLVTLLLFGVRFDALSKLGKNFRFLTIALLANFVAIPLIGYGIAFLFVSTQPLFFVGLIIYFMSPCTDWFLSFTRLSKGNVALGSALIPINMVLQLLLYPLYLQWFTHNTVQIEAGTIGNTLLQWFLLPLLIAIVAHQAFRRLLRPTNFKYVLNMSDRATVWITALLILQIFAGNIALTLANISLLFWVVLAVFCFFVITFLLGEGLSHALKLRYPERALLSITMASRNAPLMLAISMVALPDQPLIYAALVIGMLIEIPHLTALRYVLLSTRKHDQHDTLGTAIKQV